MTATLVYGVIPALILMAYFIIRIPALHNAPLPQTVLKYASTLTTSYVGVVAVFSHEWLPMYALGIGMLTIVSERVDIEKTIRIPLERRETITLGLLMGATLVGIASAASWQWLPTLVLVQYVLNLHFSAAGMWDVIKNECRVLVALRTSEEYGEWRLYHQIVQAIYILYHWILLVSSLLIRVAALA